MHLVRIMFAYLIFVITALAQAKWDRSGLSGLSLDQARHYLEDKPGGQSASDLVDAAFAGGEMQLIQFCFTQQNTNSFFLGAVEKVKDENFRDAVVLMMLKTDSPTYWMNEGLGSKIWHYEMIEPLIPTFQRHLPNAKPLLEILMTKELRIKTADELEAAMSGQKALGPIPSVGPTPISNTPAITPPPIGKNLTREKNLSAQSEKRDPFPLAWVLLAAMVAAAAGVFLKILK